jgi:superfamily II DNA helicase RecQ
MFGLRTPPASVVAPPALPGPPLSPFPPAQAAGPPALVVQQAAATLPPATVYVPPMPAGLVGAHVPLPWQRAMASMYGPDFRYSSNVQAAAHSALAADMTPLLVVLRCGGGKTTLPVCRAKVYPQRIQVLVVPLVALLDEHFCTLTAAGVKAIIYDDSTTIIDNRQVIVVSADKFFQIAFLELLGKVNLRGILDYIFFDECHVVLQQAHFRPALKAFVDIQRTCSRLVFLSATLPPRDLDRFKAAFNLSHVIVLREPTNRPNIRYTVEGVKPGISLEQAAIQAFARLAADFGPDDRAIIYSDNFWSFFTVKNLSAPRFARAPLLPCPQDPVPGSSIGLGQVP